MPSYILETQDPHELVAKQQPEDLEALHQYENNCSHLNKEAMLSENTLHFATDMSENVEDDNYIINTQVAEVHTESPWNFDSDTNNIHGDEYDPLQWGNTDVDALPNGWRVVVHEESVYYENIETGETSWTIPEVSTEENAFTYSEDNITQYAEQYENTTEEG